MLEGAATRIAVEAERALHDCQPLERRLALKKRDGKVDRMVLLVAGSEPQPRGPSGDGATLRDAFPLSTRAVLEALAHGRPRAADGIVLL